MNIPLPANEEHRLRALHEYAILDTPPEVAFERITRLAAQLFHVPMALVSLVDRDRQWFKSCYGLDVRQTDREVSFCAHAILADEVMVVPDATLDARFDANPLVTGEFGLRFYAGAPLRAPDGFNLGSLCIIDTQPREFSHEQCAALSDLAAMVVDEMELRVAGEKLRVEVAESHRRQEALQSAEAKLQHERQFLKVLLESTQEGIVACDAEGNLTLFNRATREFHGLPEQSVPAEEWAEHCDLYLADGQTPMQTADIPLFRALQGEVIHDVEIVIAPKNGAFRSLLANGQAMFDDEGRKLGAVVTMHDVTARKAAEKELRESKRFAESIAESSTSIIYLFDLQKRANVYANRDLTEFLGYSAEQVKALGGDILPTIIHPDDLASLSSHLDSFQFRSDDEVVEFETRIRHADGDYRWIASRETIFNRYPDGTPCQILGNSIDITPRKEAETALRAANDELEIRVARRTDALAKINAKLHESRERLQAILDNTSAVVYLKDLEGRYLLVNHKFELLFNVGRKTLFGKTDYDFFPAEMADAFKANDQRVVQAGGPLEIEEEAPQSDGLHTYISIKFPLRDADGKPYAVCGISTDITERKRSEVALQVAKEEAERANAAKDVFLSRMSHELRTPLNAILGFAQILEMQENELTSDHNESVRQILKAGRHQLDLVNEVLDIARINAPDSVLSPEAVALSEVIQEALDMLQSLAAPTRISLTQQFADAPPIFVLADRQRLLQILLNLLANAIKYNKPNGQVRVSAEVLPQNRVRVHVRDTGHGIAAEDLPKLFAPFSRLNADRLGVEGTGLGLMLCQRLAQAMSGSLDVESQPGLGSTFSVELPLAQPPAETASADLIASALSMNGVVAPATVTPLITAPLAKHTILLIEDNMSNFQVIERLLNDFSDVRLVGAMQGGLGVELAIHHRPELILLDLHLPDIMGDEVLRRLQASPETQNIPVIVLSADATPSQISLLLALGAQQYLTKPLDVKQFIQAVNETIHAR